MRFSLRRWRPRHLLLSWATYWIGLALVMLGPAIAAAVRATRGDTKGSISASMGDGGLKVDIVEQGVTVWQGSTSLLALTLWVLGPPVLLWLVWLTQRPNGSRAASDVEVRKLAEPAPSPESVVRPRPPAVRQDLRR